MQNSTATTKEILMNYYNGIQQKNGWQPMISDDMDFSGTGVQTSKGKDGYVTATERFLKMVKSSAIKEMIIEGDKACVVVNYELQSPKGNIGLCQVAEILLVKNGKINSSVIYFDTAALKDFNAKG